MTKALFPADEDARIKDLLSYNILDTEEENEFNDLIKLASHICHCETAGITFVDTDRQWFKARINLPAKETAWDTSFCAHAILDEKVTIINDATKDSRFMNNPEVTGGLKIAFYAGAPIVSSTGFSLGTVCVIDKKAKDGLTANQQDALKIIASQVSRLLELKLKNNIILEQTEQIVAKEKRITRVNIDTQEETNTHIATELYENFAQTLAASKLYIELALKAKDLNKVLLEKSMVGLADVIDQLKILSKAISPTTFEHADYRVLIENLCTDFSLLNEIEVGFYPNKELSEIKEKSGLMLYRIIEQQLKIAKDSNATNIEVSLAEGKNLCLIFKHNGLVDDNNFDHQVSYSNIIARTQLLNAKPGYVKKVDDFHIYEIRIPLTEAS